MKSGRSGSGMLKGSAAICSVLVDYDLILFEYGRVCEVRREACRERGL